MVDFYGHIDLNNNEMQKLVFQLETTKGTSVSKGAVAFEGHTLFLSVGPSGGDPIWIPITNTIDTYVHTQDIASTSWTITHKLGNVSPIIQVYDENNNMIIPDNVVVKGSHELIVTLSTAITGRAVVLIGSTEDWTNIKQTILEDTISEGNLSVDRLTVTNVNGNWDSVIGTVSRASGKYYYEVTYDVAGSDQFGFGITNDPKSQITSSYASFYPQQIACWINWLINIVPECVIRSDDTVRATNTTLGNNAGSVFGVLWDADSGTLAIRVASGVNYIQYTEASKAGLDAWPIASTKAGQTITFNFGATNFIYTIPTGYSSWDGSQSD